LTENGRNLHVDNYRSTKQLGTGCFGSVYKVVDVKTNQVYALKLFNKDLIKEKMSKNSHGFQEEALLNNEIKWLRELVSSVDVEPPQPSKV
jgi:serine/threonine protein kinase